MKIKTFSGIAQWFFLLWLVLGFNACDADKKNLIIPTQIITGSISAITFNSAECTGTVDSGSETVTEVGHCWSETNNQPTIADTKTSQTSVNKKQTFISTLTALTSEKLHYVRAYAIINGKAFYGDLVTFTTTKAPVPPPTIITNQATDILYNSAKVSFTIQFTGGSSGTDHGVCWATTSNPTINDSKTSLGNANGTINSESIVENLTEKTTYYARAYAVINGSTYYGNVVSFTTSDAAPIINTDVVSDILTNAATVAFTIQLADGTSATQHGICWATTTNPTINNNKTTLGATNTNVNTTSLLVGLTAKTTYYVRAYAIVNGTTYYGNVVNFSTPTDTPQTTDGSAGFLFYNSSSGQAVFGEIINNNYKDIKILGSIGSNWSQVVAYQGMLLMTSSASNRLSFGQGALFDGKETIKSFPTGTFSNWTHLTVIADKWLLFYNTNNGKFEFGEIQNLNYRSLLNGDDFSSGWSTILSFGNDLFFYNKTNGIGVWGIFNGSAFTMYNNRNNLSRLLEGITYGTNGSFWWYEGGAVYNYSSSTSGPALTEEEKLNLQLFPEVSAGNNNNLVQMSGTQMSVFSVENDNKLIFRRNTDINTWTHLVTIKFN